MKTWLENKWDSIRTNFWFLPITMSIISIILCLGLIFLDTLVTVDIDGPLSWLHAGNPESVRSLLTVLVGSLVTSLSIVYSLTLVALTMAATQFGPRLVRTFMRNQVNQIVLGGFAVIL